MSRVKKMLVGVLVFAMLMSMAFTTTAFAAEEFTVHTKAPSTWSEPGLWAWSAPDGTNVFSAWPGQKLTKDDTNEGWFSYSIPDWANSIIINEGVDGGGQTADVSIEAKELWITVADDFSTTVAYEAPEGFIVAEAADQVDADVPKTGVASMAFVWVGAAAISGVGAILAKRKKA